MRAAHNMTRFLFRALLSAALVASSLSLTFAPVPARADTYDSIKACMKTLAAPQLAGVKIAAKLSDGHFLQCTSQISSGDVVMIAIAGALTALALGGEIKGEADCNAKINAVIGLLLVKVLLSSDAVKSILGADIVEMLQTYISGNGAALLSQIPALSMVFNEITCGCAVAGIPEEVKQELMEIYSNANECGGFAAEIGEAFLANLESGIDAAGNLLSDATCVLTGGLLLCPEDHATNENDPAPTLPSPPKCIGAMTPKSAYIHGTCQCLPPKGKIFSPDGKSVGCQTCPPGQGRDSKGACAACPPGKKTGPDTFGVCSISYTCPAGTQYNATNTGCEKSCGDGAVFDGKSCKTCPANTYSDYIDTGTSAGECKSCPYGSWSYAEQSVCYSNCTPAQKWNGKSCENLCPAGTRLNTKEFGETCLPCDKGTESNEAATACTACPAGSTWTALPTGGGRCACPKGSAKSGGACKPCPAGTTWSSDEKGEYCKGPEGFPCGSGQKKVDGVCIADCGLHAVNDKKNPKQCVACKEGEIAYGGVCIGATIATTPGTAGVSNPKLPQAPMCPEGSQLNAAGNACVKRAAGKPDPAEKCAAMGPNYVVNESVRDGCKKCPLGKIANASRTVCISARGPSVPDKPAPVDPPHINVPATRAPAPAPPPNTCGGKPY